MKPSIGRIVIAFVDPLRNNGSDVCPAVITRVWSDTMVNVRTLNDSENLEWKTSITLFENEGQARASGNNHSCFWPARV